jgi:hypothetical protein
VHSKHNPRSRDPGKTRPEWFSHEKCYLNLLKTLDESPFAQHVTLTVIYDGMQNDFQDDFMSRHLATPRIYPIVVMMVEAGSNMKSWHAALQQASSAPADDQDLIYFLENDYLHLPRWIDNVFQLYSSGIAFDYISLYDHKDKYFLSMYASLTSKLFITESRHWRTTPSTCGTFILRRKTLLDDMHLWAMEIQDHLVFTELCENRGRVLLTPVPGLATHCMDGYLSPTINWEHI